MVLVEKLNLILIVKIYLCWINSLVTFNLILMPIFDNFILVEKNNFLIKKYFFIFYLLLFFEDISLLLDFFIDVVFGELLKIIL